MVLQNGETPGWERKRTAKLGEKALGEK